MRPLDGVTVAELGGRISAGACGTLLAHLGATVLYVEGHNLPGEKWAHRATFALGKEPVDTSRRAQSVAAADIIITSSDIDEEQTEYPRAIHIDLTAFGHTGPLAGKPYSDALIQALTGVADTNGQEDGGPFAAGAPILEYEAAIYGAAAAVAALRVQRLGGPNQSADVSLFDCGINSLPTYLPAHHDGKIPVREGNRHPLVVPWNSFSTSDGDVLICTVSNEHFTILCGIIGRPEIPETILENNDRVANRGLIEEAITDWTSSHTVAECMTALSEAGIASGPITVIDDLPSEANLVHRKSIIQAKDGERPFLAKTPFFTNDAWTSAIADTVKPADSGKIPEAGETAGGNGGPTLPLDGIRVIEFGQFTTAPLCARHLATLGAEVIKIEPVTGDVARQWNPARDDIGYYFMYSNADKHALAVNMRDEEGWNIVRDLIASADVIVQNMKPGSLDRLGFGWKDVQKFNPSMVCVGISGFGDDSAYKGRPAVDTIVQGSSGIMDLTRDGDVPLSTGISYSDITGGQLAMLGVVAGLELRERTGKGMNYDISMQDVTSWVTETTWNIAAEQRGPNGAAVECSDGYVWMENPADADGIDTASKTRAAMFGGLAPKGIKLAPVLNVSEAAIHPQTLARALIVDGEWETGPWPLLGSPMKLSKTPPQVRRPINRPEAPTAEVLAKFGIRRDTAAE
ncbi:MAG: CoA transferase [Pseudomonadota bacterium]|jgi:crotonobetainyl-CoA:carnitine CoA-transferase CaiB-like acyl-CoA transferase|nr:CoA transferase [Pseudomonadota bacterium]